MKEQSPDNPTTRATSHDRRDGIGALSVEFLRSLVAGSPNRVLVAPIDDPLTPIYMNPAGLRMSGVTDLDEYRRLVVEGLSEEEKQDYFQSVVEPVKRGETVRVQGQLRNRKSSRATSVMSTAFPVNATGDDSDPPTHLGIISVNVDELTTGIQQAERKVERQQALILTVQDLYGAEKERGNYLRTVQQIATHASSLLAVDEAIEYVATALRDSFGYYLVAIYLLDDSSSNAVLTAGAGAGETGVPVGLSIPVDAQSLVGWVAYFGDEIAVDDVGVEARYEPLEGWPETRAQMIVPIKHSETVLGIIDVHDREPNAFGDADRAAIRILAGQLAIAIENARLFEQNRAIGVLGERNRIAREIHDSLAQRLSEIHWQLSAVEQTLESEGSEVDPMALVERVDSMVQRAMSEARRSIWDLTTSELETHSLADAVHAIAQKAAEDGGLELSFEVEQPQAVGLPGVEAAVFRVCQEAINNIVKHASAGSFAIKIWTSANDLLVSIEDDGVGFNPDALPPPSQTSGYGLVSMRERASLVDGELTITSTPNEGTRVLLEIPLQAGRP